MRSREDNMGAAPYHAAVRFGLVHNLVAGGDPTHVERLQAALVNALGTPVQVTLADSYAALTQWFVHGTVDVAWLAPALVVESARRGHLAMVAAAVRGGTCEYNAVLMVKQHAQYQCLADLRGARAGWVDPWSAAGYLFPRKLLRAAKLDPGQLFTEQRFYGTHRAVAEALAEGEIDVGALFADPDEGPRAGLSPWTRSMGLRPLAKASGIPGDALCALTRLPGDFVESLSARICSPAGEPVAALLEAERFLPRRIEDYRPVREALEDEWGRTSSEPPGA